LNATAIPGFLKYPALVVDKTRASGSEKPGLETLPPTDAVLKSVRN